MAPPKPGPLAYCDARLFHTVSAFMAHQDVRFFLNGVFIEPRQEGGVYVVATDGHRMGVGFDPHGYADAPRICTVPPELPKYLRKRHAERVVFNAGTCRVMRATDDEAPALLPAEPSEFSPVFASAPIDASFPNWRKVVADNAGVPKAREFAVSRQYLQALAKVPGLGNRWEGVTISPRSTAACLFRFAGVDNFFGLVMPMRTAAGHSAELPRWFTHPGQGDQNVRERVA